MDDVAGLNSGYDAELAELAELAGMSNGGDHRI